MELPFAVESPERTSQLLSPTGNDGSSLVTTSSQGSFFDSSTTSGFHGGINNTNHNNMTTVHNPHPTANNHMTATMLQQQQQQQQRLQEQQQQQRVARQHQQPMLHHSPPVVSPPAAPPQRPTPSTTGGGLTSGLNIFGSLRVPSVLSSKSKQRQPAVVDATTSKPSLEAIDFTYVNVCETDADEVDITLDGQHTAMDGLQGMLGGKDGETLNTKRGDVLALLLSGVAQQQQDDSQNEALVRQCEEANQAACDAIEAKRDGELQRALEAHSQSAKQFREAALLIKDRNMSMANSLLLLSQTQAKSALALKRIVKQQSLPHDSNAPGGAKNPRSKIITQKDRLRAAVRGALVTRNEAEMSDSAFLGRATKGPMTTTSPSQTAIDSNSRTTSSQSNTSSASSSAGHAHHNPVDDMMELERELRDMDMALELGNSIASLDARTQSRLKNSFGADGSFMVVPPGSQSYMSSSNMWSPSPATGGGGTSQRNSNNKQRTTSGNTSVRARANRVQNLVGANPRSPPHAIQQQQPQHQQQQSQPQQQNRTPAAGLESSWWGNSSTTSQVLASSVISLGASSMRGGVGGEVGGSSGGTLDPNASSANTKQLMRLMDALKTLGDENANLLREVEEAEAARMEAKAAKEQMAKFKSEYGKRFENLKAALEKFRKGYPENGPVVSGSNSTTNPVTNSEFMRTASNTEQLQRQEQLIRKLTADLKKEKEESKKKDQALRKYESFYREVKARSAQKAAQRQREAAGAHPRPPQPQSHGGNRRAGHR